MPTSESALLEVDAPANSYDDAAAAAREIAAADKPVEEDTVDDNAPALCPIASYEDDVWDAGSAVEAAPSDTTRATLVGVVEFGFTVVGKLVCAHVETSGYCGKSLPAPRAYVDWPNRKDVIM